MTVKTEFCDAASFTELWDFVSLFQTSSLSTFHQVMHVYVRKFKVNPLHVSITLLFGKELFYAGGGIRV